MVNPHSDDLDSFYLMGQRAPGQAIVTGPAKPQKWDEQAGAGAGGATLAYGGPGLATFDVQIVMFESAHFVAWEAWRLLVDKPPRGPDGKAVAAMEARHPIVDDLGANSVIVLERTGLVPLDDTGKWGVTIKFKQFRKPAPVLGNSKASSTIDGPAGATKFAGPVPTGAEINIIVKTAILNSQTGVLNGL